MDKQDTYLQVISESCPDLPIRNAVFHYKDGQFNDILIINNEIIFRFPRYAEGVQNIQNEVRILSRIQGYITLPIPDPIFSSKNERKPGRVFMGYTMIPGEPLWRKTLISIEDEELLQRIAFQLARFLKELHGIPVEGLGPDLPIHDSAAKMAELYAEIRTHLFRFMRPEARNWVNDHFEAYLDTTHLHVYPLTLHHGDFGGSNILYSRESQTISGVIDFSSAGLGDPAHDIAAVSTYGDSFLARFFSTYPEIETMMERATFYRGTFALQEALHGIKNGDQAAFKAGIAPYI